MFSVYMVAFKRRFITNEIVRHNDFKEIFLKKLQCASVPIIREVNDLPHTHIHTDTNVFQ